MCFGITQGKMCIYSDICKIFPACCTFIYLTFISVDPKMSVEVWLVIERFATGFKGKHVNRMNNKNWLMKVLKCSMNAKCDNMTPGPGPSPQIRCSNNMKWRVAADNSDYCKKYVKFTSYLIQGRLWSIEYGKFSTSHWLSKLIVKII